MTEKILRLHLLHSNRNLSLTSGPPEDTAGSNSSNKLTIIAVSVLAGVLVLVVGALALWYVAKKTDLMTTRHTARISPESNLELKKREAQRERAARRGKGQGRQEATRSFLCA